MSRVAVIIAVSVLSVSCGTSGGSATCRELRESEDPASNLHVIDPATAVFLTDPPTSGPHVSGAIPVGVIEVSLDPAIQVSILESGAALIQYDASLDSHAVDTIIALARPGVVIAPGENLPQPIVATAWTWKLTCSAPDAAIERFLAERVAEAPGSD